MLYTVTGKIRKIARNNQLWIMIIDALEVSEFAFYRFFGCKKVAYLNVQNVRPLIRNKIYFIIICFAHLNFIASM